MFQLMRDSYIALNRESASFLVLFEIDISAHSGLHFQTVR